MTVTTALKTPSPSPTAPFTSPTLHGRGSGHDDDCQSYSQGLQWYIYVFIYVDRFSKCISVYIPPVHVDGLRITYSTVMILQQMVTVCSIEAFSNLYVGVAGPGMYTALLGHTKCVKFKGTNAFHLVSNKNA